jgi:diaminohydroxyphosphoribosylaminopyrimidine deaminase/5-amino-6-(5-phosphoribosylamino)uracil reductase
MTPVPTNQDFQWMAHALRLAQQGLYTTSPNPRVGCVIVKNHQLIGQGAHLKAGEPHAEVYALGEAGINAEGADIYVTLEPCSHYGRTPPCVEAVIAAKPRCVIIAMQDPNPLVAGRSVLALQSAGIEVLVGVMEQEARLLNLGFISRMTRGLPYVRCKVATSLDGRTALSNGSSQWITGDAARLDVQHWRAQSCAIVTGIGTVLLDNPSMTVRLPDPSRQPLRVIVDSRLQTPLDSKMLAAEILQQSPVLIAYADDVEQRASALSLAGAELLHLPGTNGKVDLTALMSALAQRGANEILLEAGQNLNGAFLEANLIDEFIFYYAPKLMGNAAHAMFVMPELSDMQQVKAYSITDVRQLGQDLRLRLSTRS